MMQILQAVGLPVDSVGDVAAMASAMSSLGTRHRGMTGVYQHIGPDENLELWLHYDSKRQPLGLHPHFMGTGRFRCRIEGHWRSSIDQLLGLVTISVLPIDVGDPFPIVAAVPDYELVHAALTLNEHDPSQRIEGLVQVTAFAKSLRVHKDLASFQQSDDSMTKWGACSVVPYGMFDAEQIRKSGPEPVAAISGQVESCQRQTCSFGNCEYWW